MVSGPCNRYTANVAGFSVHQSSQTNPRAMGDTEELKKQNEKLMEQIKTLSIRLAQGSSG
jgi:hypothetical protein